MKKENLKTGHPIHTLIAEHEIILGFLDKLEEMNKSIQEEKSYDNQNKKFSQLTNLVKHLIEAEPHHKREEEVLFPEMEQHGVFGPPEMMRLEHAELRKSKEKLKEISQSFNEENFFALKEGFSKTSKFIVAFLRDHIFKENNILYPMALEVITQGDVWQKMKREGDKIGYCCFTPTP